MGRMRGWRVNGNFKKQKAEHSSKEKRRQGINSQMASAIRIDSGAPPRTPPVFVDGRKILTADGFPNGPH